MSKFKTKKANETPGISTASLPDIIFMLLFFFMVTTTMRNTNLLLRIDQPAATEVQKLEKKSLVDYIFIGPPIDKKLGDEPRIQCNDQLITDPVRIREFIKLGFEQRNEYERKYITTSLKVDEETKMGIITDVKQELRKSGAFKINYSTRKRRELR